MEKIREYLENNKRAFYLVVVFIILIITHFITKPKPKQGTNVEVLPQQEVLPPVTKEDELKSIVPSQQPEVKNLETTGQVQAATVSEQKISGQKLVFTPRTTYSLVEDISKYYIGKVDPYKPAIFLHSRVQSTNLPKVGPIPWPASDTEVAPQRQLRLAGIVFDKVPIAIIEDEKGDYIVKSGDTFSNYKVINISSSEVVLKKEDKLINLKIE